MRLARLEQLIMGEPLGWIERWSDTHLGGDIGVLATDNANRAQSVCRSRSGHMRSSLQTIKHSGVTWTGRPRLSMHIRPLKLQNEANFHRMKTVLPTRALAFDCAAASDPCWV